MRFCFAVLFILAACAHVREDELALRLEPPSLASTCQEALSRPLFEEGAWPSEQWWEMLGDPQLNRLIERALQESPTLRKALAKVAAAEQTAKEERASLFPYLGADATENWEYFSKNGFIRSFYPIPPGVQIPATTNQLDLSLNFNYELDFFGRNRKRAEASLDKARAERAEASEAILLLTTHIAQVYIELQMKWAQHALVEEKLAMRGAHWELTGLRRMEGLDPEHPFLGQERQVYALEQTLIALEKEIALDTHLLNVLVGQGPDAPLITEPFTVLFDQVIALPKELSTDLLARRPDLVAQSWRVESAAELIGAAKADFYPRVNLVAFAGLESLAFSKLLSISSKQGGLEPALHLPLFTGGQLTAKLKAQVALFNEATYEYNTLILHAAREVADSLVQLTATHDTLTYQRANLELASWQVELSEARYSQGVSSLLPLLDMQEELLQEGYLLYGYERDYLLSVLKLIKALGGGYRS